MKTKLIFIITLLLAIPDMCLTYAQAPEGEVTETLELSTYYPAPYGEYDELSAENLIANKVSVGTYPLPTCDGTMLIEGNVGIGTTAPNYRLDVNGIINATGYYENGSPFASGYWAASGNDIYNTNGGYVGIGTTTPLTRLELNDGAFLARGTYNAGWTEQNLGAGTRLLWYPKKAAFRAGQVTSDQWNDANIGNYSIAMGYDTKASASFTTVLGGANNTASGYSATVSGGRQNTASARAATISGGEDNTATDINATVSGGTSNSASEERATVGGGYDNTASGISATVSGGENNTATATAATISGGEDNTVTNINATVSGGMSNVASAERATVGGGYDNTASGYSATISGGELNQATWPYATVSGGQRNTAEGYFATIVGGADNTTFGNYAIVAGGDRNRAVMLSFAAGKRAKAVNAGCFVWADYQDADYSTTADKQFRVRAQGGAFLNANPWSDVTEFMDVLKEDEAKEAEIVAIAKRDRLGRSSKPFDENIIGVVSGPRTATLNLGKEEPLYEDTIKLSIALVGRVFVKVANESGPVKLGDPITSSSIPGIGMKASKTGKIIGYAMENADFKDTKDIKEILVFVNIGYYLSSEDYTKLNKIDQLEKEIEELKAKPDIE